MNFKDRTNWQNEHHIYPAILINSNNSSVPKDPKKLNKITGIQVKLRSSEVR